MGNTPYFMIIHLKRLPCFLYSELKMSEDLGDGIPPEEKPEVVEMPSNDVLPHESVPGLVEAEILPTSSHEEHGQAAQSASNGQKGDIFINENPLTEKIAENLPSSGELAEDMPTECIETVSLDAEPESEETPPEQSTPVSNIFISINVLPSLLCKNRVL